MTEGPSVVFDALPEGVQDPGVVTWFDPAFDGPDTDPYMIRIDGPGQEPIEGGFADRRGTVEGIPQGDGQENLPKMYRKNRWIALELLKAGLEKEAWRMVRCGAPIVKMMDRTTWKDEYHAFRCEQIVCPYCQKIRGARIREGYAEIFKQIGGKRRKGYAFKFLTLTYKTGKDLEERMKRGHKDLFNFWRTLKKIYEGMGWIASFEVGEGMNLHIHVLLYAPFIPQKMISEIWHGITKDSFITDIRAVKGNAVDALLEVLKYATKVSTAIDIERLPEIVKIFKKRRRVVSFGIFYGLMKKANELIAQRLYNEGKKNLVWVGLDYTNCHVSLFNLPPP